MLRKPALTLLAGLALAAGLDLTPAVAKDTGLAYISSEKDSTLTMVDVNRRLFNPREILDMNKQLIAMALALAGGNLAYAEDDVAPSDAQIEAAFKKADPDNDGTLDLGEYLDALTAQAK